jgi:hypothetical protein
MTTAEWALDCTLLGWVPVHDSSGRLLARAGTAFAAVWVLAIGGRIAFAELATHSWGPAVARFSIAHQITGADAWRAAFVLMALVMVLTRITALALAAARAPRPTSPALDPATA